MRAEHSEVPGKERVQLRWNVPTCRNPFMVNFAKWNKGGPSGALMHFSIETRIPDNVLGYDLETFICITYDVYLLP